MDRMDDVLARAREENARPPDLTGLDEYQRRSVEQAGQYAKMLVRVYRGEGTPKEVLKTKCLECMGWQLDEVKQCSAPSCPLYEIRKRYFRTRT